MQHDLPRLWHVLVETFGAPAAVALVVYVGLIGLILVTILVRGERAVARLRRQRHLRLVDRERTLAAIATATPQVTRPAAGQKTLAGRMARRRAEQEGGDDAA